MPSGPVRKRPVSASRTPVAEKRPTARGRRSAEILVEDEAPTRNYALSLTESVDDSVDAAGTDNFAMRMSEALRAIEAAQGGTDVDEPRPQRRRAAPLAVPSRVPEDSVAFSEAAREPRSGGRAPLAKSGLSTWLKTLDKMPPIRLPVGPAISWRVGLPALVAVAVVMIFVGRPSARADAQGTRLPSQETYAVQQEAPLFASNAQAAQPVQAAAAQPVQAAATQPVQAAASQPVQAAASQPVQAAASQPIGVPEPSTGSFDFFDVGFKLVAVLALAYGSLMLLKRAGLGGSAAARAGGAIQGMRIVSSLALAPNRSVHVLKVPGGKTLLVGATPNSVNLIADLGDLPEDETPEVASFFDALKGKIGS